MGYVYKHTRLDTNEIFYIGIGGFDKNEKQGSYFRAYSKDRNNLWIKIVNKTEYKVEIIQENLSWNEASDKEKEFIKLYGRINLKTGTLSNLTDGGDGMCGFIAWNRGLKNCYKVSEETKLKISNSSKGKIGYIMTDEIREKISKSKIGINKGENNFKSKKILCVETNKIYNCGREAAEDLKINLRNINRVCNGERLSCGGFKFIFI